MFISFKITHLYDHSYNFHTSIYVPFIPHRIVIILPLIVIISLIATGALPVTNMVTILKTQTTNNFIRIRGKMDRHRRRCAAMEVPAEMTAGAE